MQPARAEGSGPRRRRGSLWRPSYRLPRFAVPQTLPHLLCGLYRT